MNKIFHGQGIKGGTYIAGKLQGNTLNKEMRLCQTYYGDARALQFDEWLIKCPDIEDIKPMLQVRVEEKLYETDYETFCLHAFVPKEYFAGSINKVLYLSKKWWDIYDHGVQVQKKEKIKIEPMATQVAFQQKLL